MSSVGNDFSPSGFSPQAWPDYTKAAFEDRPLDGPVWPGSDLKTIVWTIGDGEGETKYSIVSMPALILHKHQPLKPLYLTITTPISSNLEE